MRKLFTSARVTEVDTLSDKIVRLYKADSSLESDVFLKTTMGEIETLSEQLTIAIKQDKVLSLLDEADSARDEALKAFGKIIDGYCFFPIEEKKQTATELATVFAKYRKTISTENYETESSLIESLLTDLAADSAKKAIGVLDGVAETIVSIREAQNTFNKVDDEYTAARQAKGRSASSYKKPLLKLINENLRKYLEVMLMTTPDTYADFAGKVEEEITTINDKVKARSKNAQNEGTE